MMDPDDFYIGYETGMTPAIRRAVVRAVVVAALAAILAAALFVGSERPLADSRFEFGAVHRFEGYLSLQPAPVLLVVDREGWRPHWLVARGKFGAAAALGDARPGWVTLSGTLVERDSWRMIEVLEGTVHPSGSTRPAPEPAPAPVRREVLRGEIVDGKCYLGVMNPGERTVHRDCAVRCLAGGVPAMFAYRDKTGSHLALLLGADAQLRQDHVGRPVALSGSLSGPEEALVFAVGGAH